MDATAGDEALTRRLTPPGSPTPSPPVVRQVLGLALPALAQQYFHLVVQLSDQFLAGRIPVPDPDQRPAYLAALTTAGYLYWFVSSYTVLVSVGSTALVARFVGAGDRAAANRAAGQAVVLAAAFGLAGSAAGLLGLPTLIDALQLTGPSAAYCAEFLTPLAALLAFQIVESACAACLAGAGDTRTGLKVLGGMAVLNVPLAWGLGFGVGPVPGMGFVGIALGTALSHVVGCVILLALLARGRSGLKLTAANLVPDRDLMYRLLRVSVPAAVDSLSVAACQLWFLSVVNRLGDVPAAAHGGALRWEALGYLAGNAFGIAAMTLVGQNVGARDPARGARAVRIAFVLGCGVMTFMGVLFVALARPMLRVFFPDPAQDAVVDAGVPVLRLVAVAMPALAGQIVFTAALRGAGDTRVPVLITWLGFLGVRIPLAYALTGPAGLGLFGAWVAMCADIWVRGLGLTARFAAGRWKHVRV